MRPVSNACGAKNYFGYYDSKAGEIVLRHPFAKKRDVEEVYLWLEDSETLEKLSIGVGAVENFVIQDNGDTLYSSARKIIKQSVMQAQVLDNDILKNLLMRVKNKKHLRNLGIKGYIFENDAALFNELLQTIRSLKSLVYLDLSGSFFTDEQLISLAEALSASHIAHLIWPEARLSELIIRTIMMKLKANRSLVVMRGVPLEFQNIAKQNRSWLFNLVHEPALITDEEKATLQEYIDSFRLGLAYEKQRFFDIEKAVEAILA